MNATEFETKRTILVDMLRLRAGQSNWRLVSEICADILDLEGEWNLSHPLSGVERDSALYAPVVAEMNERQSARDGQ